MIIFMLGRYYRRGVSFSGITKGSQCPFVLHLNSNFDQVDKCVLDFFNYNYDFLVVTNKLSVGRHFIIR